MSHGQITPNVLVVDDEQNIRDAVAYNLRREGIDVTLASDGIDALIQARLLRPDLVVLDIMLPGMDGFEVLRTLRAESTVPILMLSARGEAADRVNGLEIGADDYLVKPFAMRELVARVQAMLRRARMHLPTAEPAAAGSMPAAVATRGPLGTRIVAGDLEMDTATRLATISGEGMTLKPKEFDLLLYFAGHPGVVLSRDALLREVWGYEFPVDTRTVDVHIRWLRQKIERDPSDPVRIVTVRGLGYRFVAHAA